jgi:hypothetical protein
MATVMKTTSRDEREKSKSFRRAFAAREEAMVRGFATQFAIRHEDARKYLEGANWNYGRAFDALLVSVRTADETEKTAKALAAILAPPTAAEIERHIKPGDKSAKGVDPAF